ncbi:MAG: hypothetical protein ABDK94_04100 [Atribacterota bacterium]
MVLVVCLLAGSMAFGEEPVYLGTAIRSLTNPYYAAWAKEAEMFAEWAGLKDYNVILTCEGSSEKQLNDIKGSGGPFQGKFGILH